MKNNVLKIRTLLLFILSMLLLNLNTNAQNSKRDIFDSKNDITWLGVDYSEVRFVGPASSWGEMSTVTPTEMRDKYFSAWNDLILAEPKAFKIAEAVNRNDIKYATDVTSKANSKTNKKDIFTEDINEYQSLDEKVVRNMVKKYSFKENNGIGFVLIAEGMSKGREEGSYWATFVDMSNKEVILTKRITGKAGGFGFRNYWAGSLKSVFKTMKKDFKHWE